MNRIGEMQRMNFHARIDKGLIIIVIINVE